MKILYLSADPGVPVFGRKGCSTHVRETCLAFAELGHQVRIVCANAGEDTLGRDQVELVEIAPYQSRKLGFDLRRLLTARRLERRAAEIIHEWKPDFLYERYGLYSAAGVKLARRFGLPMMLEVNSFLSREQRERIRMPPLARMFERRLIRSAPNISAVAPPIAEEASKLRGSGEHVYHMPMAVNARAFFSRGRPEVLRAELGLPQRFTFGYVGTLTHWHGIDLLHDFARRVKASSEKEFSILVVGGDPRRIERNREKAAKEGLNQIFHFTGEVPHAEVPRYMSAMDVALIPDSTPWSSPSKLFEYQACEVPVLTARYPAIELAMTDGVEGYFFAPRDADEMARRGLEHWRDEAKRAEMGKRARMRVEREHSWRAQAQRIVDILTAAR